MITNIALGTTRATSFVNYTSGIFYHVQKYRAIKPRDASTILGFVSIKKLNTTFVVLLKINFIKIGTKLHRHLYFIE